MGIVTYFSTSSAVAPGYTVSITTQSKSTLGKASLLAVNIKRRPEIKIAMDIILTSKGCSAKYLIILLI
jgi:D-arabinose 5-phosphate isomerase GutQ